jgi:hypothetical protein
MNALAIVAPRLAPLIGKLGSDHEGEVVASARAIGKLLLKQGLGWNDLAARLTTEGVEFGEDEAVVLHHWRIAVEWIRTNPEWAPTDRERAFIFDMRRFLKRRDPTPKQAEWIAGIAERLGARVEADRWAT